MRDPDLAGFRKLIIALKLLLYVVSIEFLLENAKVDESFLVDFEILQILQGGDFSPIDQYLE